jgi:hypothetical protein
MEAETVAPARLPSGKDFDMEKTEYRAFEGAAA